MMIRLTLLLLVLASSLDAGAWPRGKGNAFFMSSVQVTAPSLEGPASYYVSTYGEIGLTDRLTFGGDIGHSVSGESKLILFLRHPIAHIGEKYWLSGEIGLGRIAGDTVLRPGLSFGTGLETKKGSGWLSADILFEHHFGKDRTDVKADITYGRNHARGFKTIIQLQAGKQMGDPSFLRIAPSVAMPMGKNTHFEIGASMALKNGAEYGLKVGIWHKF